jgi:hypothetical protein
MGWFSDDKKTFTSLTANDIFPKDTIIHTAKRSIMFGSGGNIGKFNNNFFKFKHKYRVRIPDSWMIKNGFDPYTGSTIDKIKKKLLLKKIQDEYDKDARKIISAEVAAQKIYEQTEFWLEKNGYSWSSKNNTLYDIVTNTTYNKMNVSFKKNNDPKIPDNRNIIVAEFITDKQADPANPFPNPLYIELPNEFKKDAIYVQFESNKQNQSNEIYWYICDKQSNKYLFESKNIIMSPVVALKEEGSFRFCSGNKECGKQSVVKYLNKYSIDSSNLIKSLSKTDKDGQQIVTNAYIVTGMATYDPYIIDVGTFKSTDVQNLSPRLLKRMQKSSDGAYYTVTKDVSDWWANINKRYRYAYARIIYDTLKYYGNGSISINMAGMSITYNIYTSIEIKQGVIDEAYIPLKDINGNIIGKRVNTNFALIYGHRRSENRQIKIQTSKNEYTVMTIKALNQYTYISGQWFVYLNNGTWSSSSDGKKPANVYHYPRIIIPNEMIQFATFSQYSLIKEYGMHFLIYTEKTIVTKWWKKFIGLFIAILVCVVTSGSACGVVTILINFAISYAVNYFMGRILEHIHSPWARAIFQVGVILVQSFAGGISFTSENFLSLATSVVKIGYNAYQEINQQKLRQELEYKALIDSGKSIDSSISDYNSMREIKQVVPAYDQSAHYSYLQSASPEYFYASQDAMYNYDQFYAVTEQLDYRVQVTPA